MPRWHDGYIVNSYDATNACSYKSISRMFDDESEATSFRDASSVRHAAWIARRDADGVPVRDCDRDMGLVVVKVPYSFYK